MRPMAPPAAAAVVAAIAAASTAAAVRFGGPASRACTAQVHLYATTRMPAGIGECMHDIFERVQGLAHCFERSDDGKLHDVFVIEPMSANSLECMVAGACCHRTRVRSCASQLVPFAAAAANLFDHWPRRSMGAGVPGRLGRGLHPVPALLLSRERLLTDLETCQGDGSS